MNILFNPATPQIFAGLDKEKVFKLGLSTRDVYNALQTLLGGLYVNQFNRFGRVWKVFVEAEPDYRNTVEDVGQFYVRNRANVMVPLSTLVDMKKASGPEFTTRFNEYRSIEIFGTPRARLQLRRCDESDNPGLRSGAAARHGKSRGTA